MTGTVVNRWQPGWALVVGWAGIVAAVGMLGWVVVQIYPWRVTGVQILFPTIAAAAAGLVLLLVFLWQGGRAALWIGIVSVALGALYLWMLFDALSRIARFEWGG